MFGREIEAKDVNENRQVNELQRDYSALTKLSSISKKYCFLDIDYDYFPQYLVAICLKRKISRRKN
jgi:hypothetical protein